MQKVSVEWQAGSRLFIYSSSFSIFILALKDGISQKQLTLKEPGKLKRSKVSAMAIVSTHICQKINEGIV